MSEQLQAFPVDAETLDLIEAAITTHGPDGSTSLMTTLDLLAGINPADDAAHLTPYEDESFHTHDDIDFDDRVHYHHHDVILALIAEVRRLRAVSEGTPNKEAPEHD